MSCFRCNAQTQLHMKLFRQRFRIYFKTVKLHFHEFTGCDKTTGFCVLFKIFIYLFSKITLYGVFLVKKWLSVLSNFQNPGYPIFASSLSWIKVRKYFQSSAIRLIDFSHRKTLGSWISCQNPIFSHFRFKTLPWIRVKKAFSRFESACNQFPVSNYPYMGHF